jgi:hypothetical protein
MRSAGWDKIPEHGLGMPRRLGNETQKEGHAATAFVLSYDDRGAHFARVDAAIVIVSARP